MNRLNTSRQTQVVSALVEGVSINATCRMTGIAKHTVLKLLRDLGCAAASYHDKHVRNLRVRRLQCDEIWAFVYGKDKNLTLEQVQAGAGSVWTWTAIDADSKLIISYVLGDRGAETAKVFMQDVASRIANRIQLTTDGHRVYADAVEDAFGSEIDYAMLVKIYGASNDNPESRYSPATCIGNAPLHPADERFQQEAGESRPRCSPLLHALQLLQDSSDPTRDTSDGSGDRRSRLVS